MGTKEDERRKVEILCNSCRGTGIMREDQRGPTCGHSICSQHYIDSGEPACVEGGGRIEGTFAVLDNAGSNRFEWRSRVIPNVDHDSSDDEVRHQADAATPEWGSDEFEVWLLASWDHAPPCCHAQSKEKALHACTICLCDCYRPEPSVGVSPPCHECGRHFFHKEECPLFGEGSHAPSGA